MYDVLFALSVVHAAPDVGLEESNELVFGDARFEVLVCCQSADRIVADLFVLRGKSILAPTKRDYV